MLLTLFNSILSSQCNKTSMCKFAVFFQHVSLFPVSHLLHRPCAAHVIVQFTLRLLDEELSSPCEYVGSRTLCGAFIFVCRQIYNTCVGLQVVQPHGLHRAIAVAWRQVPVLNSNHEILIRCNFCSFPTAFIG